MIELKNVCKTYKSKKADNTVALKDISIKFPEKGLVVIFGRSGSGKSTLLHVIGGLDKYDSGDVIINGKSTKDFKESDFDAYRNTYMGFVFQEYNLLDNYSIEQNIKLSLELQHKKPTEQEIQDVLKMVELKDISKRKTNELSGGQKQRIAIARALIKNPEIILADEPTGNLDSRTSGQIWTLLRKLSEDKLVVVVSHDESAAQKYADRIIEIQDGEIFSDNGKEEELTNTKKFELKKAKLPFFYSFKMGVESLFHKKFVLVLSILMLIFSILCFELMLSAYTINLNNNCVQQLEENGPVEVNLTKYKNKINYVDIIKEQLASITNQVQGKEDTTEDYSKKYETLELDNDFIKKAQENTGLNWHKVYTITDKNGSDVSMKYLENTDVLNARLYYYLTSYIESGYTFIETDNAKLSNLMGRRPQSEDEVVVSGYIADCILYYGINAKSSKDGEVKEYKPYSYYELLEDGMYIDICGIDYLKIVGIVDNTTTIKEKYGDLKNKKITDIDGDESELTTQFTGLMSYITENELKLYVNSSFIEKEKSLETPTSVADYNYIYNGQKHEGDVISYILSSIDVETNEGTKNISDLNYDEVVINENILDDMTYQDYENKYSENKDNFESKQAFLDNYLKNNEIIGSTIITSINSGKNVTEEDKYVEYKIVGVVLNDDNTTTVHKMYYNKDNIKTLIDSNVKLYSIATRVTTADEMRTVLKYYPMDDSDVISTSEYSKTILNAVLIASTIGQVGKYGTIFFLIFSIIIVMNFINSSVRFRKKEIGTLRALGCRSVDIINMFLYESIIMLAIALLVTFAIMPNIINNVNNFVTSTLMINVNILAFGFKQIIGVIGILLGIVVVANIIPLKRITKMKPIDAILNK